MTNEVMNAYMETGLMPKCLYQIIAWDIMRAILWIICFSVSSLVCFKLSKKFPNDKVIYVLVGWVCAIGSLLLLAVIFKILMVPELYLLSNVK